jgi:hypothetical protein
MAWWGAVAAGAALASIDVPAPTFVGATEADTVLLDRAWQAAASCAGWVAPHHDTVEVAYVQNPWGWSGHAHLDARGMHRIELHPGYNPTTVVHEVAHAWVSFRPSTPKALSEGLTDLLTECAFRARPDMGTPRVRTSGEHPPPALTFWLNPDEADRDARDAGYAASLELARAAARVTGERALWPDATTRRLDWSWFWDLLASVRPYGPDHDAVLAAMGPATESEDLDGDGLSTSDERAKGLVPFDWDSDDDGFSDGIGHVPKGAIPLPLNETPVCVGWKAVSDSATFSFETAGHDDESVVVQARTPTRLLGEAADGIKLRRGEVVYMTARLDEPLFSHAQVWAVTKPGRGLEPDPACPVPGRRMDLLALPDLYPVVPLRTTPSEDDITEMLRAATQQLAGCTSRSTAAAGPDRVAVRDAASAANAVAVSCFPDLESTFRQAQAEVLGRCIQVRSATVPLSVDASSTTSVVLEEVATQPPRDRASIDVLSAWFELLATRLGTKPVVDAASWTDLLSSVRSYSDDRILRELLEVLETPLMEGDLARVEHDSPPGDATDLRSDPVWQCSGWRSSGNPPFDAASPSPRLLSLEAWDPEARVVRGIGTAASIWRAGGIRSPTGCGELEGLVWYTPSGNGAPAALLRALETHPGLGNDFDPFVVRLGGPSTGSENGGVVVSDRTITWATSTGSADVLAALIGVLGHAAELGAAVDWSLVNSEIQVRFGMRRPPQFPLEE